VSPPRVGRSATIARLLAWATVVGPLLLVVSPWLESASTYGTHDWDFETANRYLAKLSLLTYHQLPFWNPYVCGGLPAWGYVEGATTLVSPWLVPYLALPMPVALRVEAIGSGLLGAVGAYVLARRFTESYAGRALVVALWACNSRWALQAAVGHTWHMMYAWTPWCLYAFDRSLSPKARFVDVLGLAVCFALLLYGGAIYPLPHVVLALALYAGVLAIKERATRPLTRLLASGALGAALSAPKLLPMLREYARTPRIIESTELTRADLLWRALTSREQTLRTRLAPGDYGWHEYGIYIGIAGVLVVLVAAVVAWGPRETPLKIVGIVLVVLGLGSFHPAAPWALLHDHVPFFRSQHVPSRFLYPALLFLALVAASGLGRLVRSRAVLDAWLAAGVLALAVDVAIVARQPMVNALHLTPTPAAASPTFHHEQASPFRYDQSRSKTSTYLSMVGNEGVIACYGFPALDRVGAVSTSDARFRGEARVISPGSPGDSASVDARVADWTPNRVVLSVRAPAGSTVVYNMNYDDGWTSGEGVVIDVDGAVGVRVNRPSDVVTLVYRPPWVVPGMLLALGACIASVLLWRRERSSGASPEPSRGGASALA